MKKDYTIGIDLGSNLYKIRVKIGNSYRLARGLREFRIDEYLNKESTWELVQSTESRINKDLLNNGNPVIIKLEDLKKQNEQLRLILGTLK